MAISVEPDRKEQDALTQTQRLGGWFRRFQHRVKLALHGDEEDLIVDNTTQVSWHLYRDFHHLGTVLAEERLTLKLLKRGSLSARPTMETDEVEYLLLPLSHKTRQVRIYRRQLTQELEVYDMQAA